MNSEDIVEMVLGEASPDWKKMHSRYKTSVVRFKELISFANERGDDLTYVKDISGYTYLQLSRLYYTDEHKAQDQLNALNKAVSPIFDIVLSKFYYEDLTEYYEANIGDDRVIAEFSDSTFYENGTLGGVHPYDELHPFSKKHVIRTLAPNVKIDGEPWWVPLVESKLKPKLPGSDAAFAFRLEKLHQNWVPSISAYGTLPVRTAIYLYHSSLK